MPAYKAACQLCVCLTGPDKENKQILYCSIAVSHPVTRVKVQLECFDVRLANLKVDYPEV